MYARRTSSQIINFAGHFKQTQVRSIIESVINLTVSLVLVFKIGMYGVLVGTIAALLYRTNDVIIYANWNILGRKPWKTYRRWIQNTVVMVLITSALCIILPEINTLMEWIMNAIWVAMLSGSVYFIVDSFFDRESFRFIREIIINVIKRRSRVIE